MHKMDIVSRHRLDRKPTVYVPTTKDCFEVDCRSSLAIGNK